MSWPGDGPEIVMTEKVTEAGFTFVALDESGKSRPVPNISGRI